jgi:hypothetical protein
MRFFIARYNLVLLFVRFGTRDSAVGIATGYGLDDQGFGVRVPVGGKNFHFSMSSRSTLGPTQPSIQWVPGAPSPSGKAAGV